MSRTGTMPAPLTRPTPAVGRLAELVAHLAGCSGEVAVEAVRRALPADLGAAAVDDRLAVIARALLDIRHGTGLRDTA